MDGATRDDLAVVAEGSPVEVPGLPALPGGLARQMTSSLYPHIWIASRGGPNTPGPGSCIAPKPMRRTVAVPRT
jgi:hypothetical protein